MTAHAQDESFSFPAAPSIQRLRENPAADFGGPFAEIPLHVLAGNPLGKHRRFEPRPNLALPRRPLNPPRALSRRTRNQGSAAGRILKVGT